MHYLLVRDLQKNGSDGQASGSGIHTLWVQPSRGESMEGLVRIAGEQGLCADWCREQLDEGGRCVLALEGERVVGMGWMTTRKFWVEEIRHWFEPGLIDCYMFATYVSLPYRGRRVQRLLDEARLRVAAEQGLRWVYAIVECTNTASLRGLARSGFERTARLDELRLSGWSLMRMRRLCRTLPAGVLRPEGTALGSLHLCGPREE